MNQLARVISISTRWWQRTVTRYTPSIAPLTQTDVCLLLTGRTVPRTQQRRLQQSPGGQNEVHPAAGQWSLSGDQRCADCGSHHTLGGPRRHVTERPPTGDQRTPIHSKNIIHARAVTTRWIVPVCRKRYNSTTILLLNEQHYRRVSTA